MIPEFGARTNIRVETREAKKVEEVEEVKEVKDRKDRTASPTLSGALRALHDFRAQTPGFTGINSGCATEADYIYLPRILRKSMVSGS
jgi:hypothetical protein